MTSEENNKVLWWVLGLIGLAFIASLGSLYTNVINDIQDLKHVQPSKREIEQIFRAIDNTTNQMQSIHDKIASLERQDMALKLDINDIKVLLKQVEGLQAGLKELREFIQYSRSRKGHEIP